MSKHPFPPHNTIGKEEKEGVMKVLQSGLLSGFQGNDSEEFYGGPVVREMEDGFKEYFKVEHAVSLNSGTSALHAAVFAASVQPGDEVIVPPYTMSATASAILMENAIPVFADIEESSFCIDPRSIEENISDRTRAIIVVHLFGVPADMDPIMELAEEYDLVVIEDAAQAPGATYKGRYCGTIGDIGVLSLNKHKVIQCGEGGIFLTDNDEFALKAQLIRNHGEVVSDEIDVLGYNYRLTELQAAVAIAQLPKLERLNQHRIRLADYLTEKLQRFDCIKTPSIAKEDRAVYYLYPMLFSEEKAGISRDLFAKAIRAEGLPIEAGYVKPIYLQPLYQRACYSRGLCPVTERLEEEELLTTSICRFPLHRKEVNLFVTGIERVLHNAVESREYAAANS